MREKKGRMEREGQKSSPEPLEGLWGDLRRNFPMGREESMWDLLGRRFGERILIHHSPLLVQRSDPWGNLPPGDSLEQKFYLRHPPPLSPTDPRYFPSTEAVPLHEKKMVGL